MIKFNINDVVFVELTDVGKEVFENHFKERGFKDSMYADESKSSIKLQFHMLIQIFHREIYVGGRNVFKDNKIHVVKGGEAMTIVQIEVAEIIRNTLAEHNLNCKYTTVDGDVRANVTGSRLKIGIDMNASVDTSKMTLYDVAELERELYRRVYAHVFKYLRHDEVYLEIYHSPQANGGYHRTNIEFRYNFQFN